MSEQQIERLKATSALLALIRQERFLCLLFDPAEVGMLIHVLSVRTGESETPAATRTREAPAWLPVNPLVMPELLPATQRLSALGTGVGPVGGVREHVGSEPAHVSELPPAARTRVLPGVGSVIQEVQLGDEIRDGGGRADWCLRRLV